MHPPRIWAVVPAAGSGSRFGGDIPKQYLKIHDRPVIEYTLRKLAALPRVTGIVVALSEQDDWWDSLGLTFEKPFYRVNGGAQRAHSVLNAISAVADQVGPHDWFLVHDAARPCVRLDDITRLINAVEAHPCGGILATPAKDTIKQAFAGSATIEKTLDRSVLWHALTPQLFRAPLLLEALQQCIVQPDGITDEASALEALGYQPMLVQGRSDNIKITQPEDLVLAEFYLGQEAAG